jgi:hypothetical protein
VTTVRIDRILKKSIARERAGTARAFARAACTGSAGGESKEERGQMRRERWMQRLAGLGATCLLVAGAAVSTAPTAGAAPVSCWGDYCSGQDPMVTGCAADAVTVAAVQLVDGRLEVAPVR